MSSSVVIIKKQMTPKSFHHTQAIDNATGSAVGIVIALVLVLTLAGGGGYWAYGKYFKKEPLRTKLSSMKMKEELIRFTHNHVSTALYHNMVMLDDIVVMMDKELKRLTRIGKKFPSQNGIVAPQTEALNTARDRLAKSLVDVTATIENIYVTWLVDRSKGTGQIKSQKGTLTRQLAEAIRGEAVLISRIRTNAEAAS